MITHEPMTVYKNIGTYHLVYDNGHDEATDTWYQPEKHFVARHFSGLEVTANSVEECKRCLDDFEVTAREIREAINKLTVYGYSVYKRQEYLDTSSDPNGLNEYAKNYVVL